MSDRVELLCPNCGSEENGSGAAYCEDCGCRLDSGLVPPPPPPTPLDPGTVVAGQFEIQSLLWAAPTYNAYAAASCDPARSAVTIVEQRSDYGDPLAGLWATDQMAEDGNPGGDAARRAAAFERFGILSPFQHKVERENLYILFGRIEGQPLAQLEQASEKEARNIGLQLCALAEQFHQHGWVYNGFEPYGVVVDRGGGVKLICFDRARRVGTPVSEAPIYPSRSYTAPELFEPDGVYDARSDIYSIGTLLQFLVTGEASGVGEGSALYPIATVFPNFERVLAAALPNDQAERYQTAAELRAALNSLNLPVILQAGHFTDVGLVRELNEDSVLALTLTQYYESIQTQVGLYIVSDGMGGEAAGEVASRITVRAIAEWVTDKLISESLKSTKAEKIVAPTHTGGLRLAIADGDEMATTEIMRMAVINANREVMEYARANPHERGLGATVTAAMVVGELLTIAHVGDSRCYLLSGDRLEQLTEDHSLVQRMIKTGSLSRAEARIHPYRNVIYRSIGSDEQVEIDIIRHKLKDGDVVLLCSDGLNGMLSDDQIRDVLLVNPDPTLAAKELVVAANAAGGEDNVSVIVARIT